MTPHTHRYATISHVSAFDDPRVLRACQVGTCAATMVVCLLCEEHGDRRVHGRHLGLTDPAALDHLEDLRIASYLANAALSDALHPAARPAPKRARA